MVILSSVFNFFLILNWVVGIVFATSLLLQALCCFRLIHIHNIKTIVKYCATAYILSLACLGYISVVSITLFT